MSRIHTRTQQRPVPEAPGVVVCVQAERREISTHEEQVPGYSSLRLFLPKPYFISALIDTHVNTHISVAGILVGTKAHRKCNLAPRNSTFRKVYDNLPEAMGTCGLRNDMKKVEEVYA